MHTLLLSLLSMSTIHSLCDHKNWLCDYTVVMLTALQTQLFLSHTAGTQMAELWLRFKSNVYLRFSTNSETTRNAFTNYYTCLDESISFAHTHTHTLRRARGFARIIFMGICCAQPQKPHTLHFVCVVCDFQLEKRTSRIRELVQAQNK